MDRDRDQGAARGALAPRPAPLDVLPRGSVYGIAFSPDRTRIALTIGVGADVRLFVGPSDLSGLHPAGELPLAVHPAFAVDGSIAVSGSQARRPRIWVDGRAVSPAGADASTPDFCEHPDGTRLVYAVQRGPRSQLVAADPSGRDASRISHGDARDTDPACSPDGRLVAFFSTRRSGDGPGLYVMRIDGHRPRKIADVTGDTLRWSRLGGDPPIAPGSSGRASTRTGSRPRTARAPRRPRR